MLAGESSPVDVERLIRAARVALVERDLSDDTRATIGRIGGRRAIILNRRWPFRSEAERRWVLAEELGHVLLDHRLVESTAPGRRQLVLPEEWKTIYEREARAFAAELLMPFEDVRRAWAELTRHPLAPTPEEDRVRYLARRFGVTPAAMRVRLRELRLL